MDDKEYLYSEIQLQKQILIQLDEMLQKEPGSKILQESFRKNNEKLKMLEKKFYEID